MGYPDQGDRPATALAAASGLLLALHVVSPSGTLGEATYGATMLCATALAWLGASRSAPAGRLRRQLVAAAVTATTLGDVAWYVVDRTGGQVNGSAADVLYFLAYLALGASLVLVLLRTAAGIDVDALIDVLTSVTLCVLVLWELVLRDLVVETDLVAMRELAGQSYPVLDAVILGLVLRAMVAPGSRRVLGVVLGLGAVLWLVADVLDLLLDAGATNPVVNAGWLLGALLLAASTFHRPSAVVTVGAPRSALPGDLGRLAMAVGPLLVPPLLVVAEEAVGRDAETWALVVGMVVLLLLAVARTERMLQRERVTRRALGQARDAAVVASEAKSVLMATITREIHGPMQEVLALNRRLGATPLDDEQRGYVEGVGAAGSSLVALVDGMLDYSRAESREVEIAAVELDLVSLVEGVGAALAGRADEQGLTLVVHASPQLPRRLVGDPDRLRQVLLELVANAVACTEEGEVVLTASLAHTTGAVVTVRFEVADTGAGVALADQGRIFEPFVRTRTTPAHRAGGTGLGLATCRQLGAAMGGVLELESRVGEGSRFLLSVPLVVPAGGSDAPVGDGLAAPARALVVDASATRGRLLREQVSAWGASATDVRDASAALVALHDAARTAPYDVVLLDDALRDSRVGEVHGLVDAARRLGCPVVVLTGRGDAGTPAPGTRGTVAHLARPVASRRLLAVLHEVLTPAPDDREPAPAAVPAPSADQGGAVAPR